MIVCIVSVALTGGLK